MNHLNSTAQLDGYQGCAFVPTMGAVHEGHLSLVRQARSMGVPVLLSIYVNPRQFAPHEDLETYPRTLEADLRAAQDAGADAVWTPDGQDIYPEGIDLDTPPLPRVATAPALEDADRPHFFGGVCAVVARLLDLVRPAHMVLGEKDWQQVQVLRSMVDRAGSRWAPLKIHAGPIVREPDGLAMSSRNVHIASEDRHAACGLSRAVALASRGEAAMRAELESSGLLVDYAVIRDAASLEAPRDGATRRALVAARLGPIRLIDNAHLDA